jgi:choice-of-anchor C domain-containing protein
MRILKLLVGAAAAATAILGATASNASVAIVNGSFEDGSFDPGSFTTLGAGDTSITGWLVGGAGVDYIGSYWTASNGVRSIDLSATGAGSISQVLSGLTIGQTYDVSFDLAGNPDGGSNTKVAVVSDGATSASYDFLMGGQTKAAMGWEAHTFSFTATGVNATLVFSSNEDSAYGPALDNVSVAEGVGGPAVPEPATWALMILGFAAVGVSLRSRRRILAV